MSYISGIQQIGIGTKNLRESMLWYKKHLGMDVLVFDDTSEADLMTQYTGGKVYERRAVLTLNMQGGGGFELWQFNDRVPLAPKNLPCFGDVGIFAGKIKCLDVEKAHDYFLKQTDAKVSSIQKNLEGKPQFWLEDINNNVFCISHCTSWFQKNDKNLGGVSGAIIGVEDMEKSLILYRDILGVNDTVYDVTDSFEDLPSNKSSGRFRRVLLRKTPNGKGAFNKLLGSINLELVQCLDRKPTKIYKDRFWGDCGFIHLCFDVLNMDALKEKAQQHGVKFSVDSNSSFAMENASGRFCYIEDSDGTLIELVETHKVPIFKKIGWYLNLKKRNLEKPLPDWMVKMLALSKVK